MFTFRFLLHLVEGAIFSYCFLKDNAVTYRFIWFSNYGECGDKNTDTKNTLQKQTILIYL